MTTNKQNTKTWTDEQGNQVPTRYLTKYDKVRHKRAQQLAKEAKSLQQRMVKFKDWFDQLAEEVYKTFLENYGLDRNDRKGNFTFMSFDGQIKVEVDVNQLIRFDDNLIQAAHAKLKEFLNNALGDQEEFMSELINNAFETSSGQLDAKRVLHLTKYRQKIKGKENHRLYNEAMDLLEQSITRPDSKRYMRIYEKDKDGKYQPIVLNFSAL